MGLRSWFESLTASAAVAVPVAESVLTGLDYDDPDANLPGTQAAGNWRRITQAASDLTPLTQERMQELALYLSDKNPLAKGILDLLVSFIVGEGFTVTAKDDDVQTAVDRFWHDGQNDLDSRVEDMTRELSIYGEQVALAFVNATSGRVALVSVDPRQIRQVMSHPAAPDRVFAVGLSPNPQTADVAKWIKVINEDDDPRSDTFGMLIGARAGETFKRGDQTLPFYQPPEAERIDADTYLAGCFFWAINKPRSAMRGRSDLLAVADFVDLFDRLLFDESERMSFMRTFVWDVKVTGATASDLQARAATESAPRPGAVRLHNESEEWNAVAPDLNTQDSQNVADLILSLVATGTALPKTWLNGIMDVNRSSSQSMDAPSLKRLTRRQRYVRRMLERMVRFVLDQAEISGPLKAADDGRHQFAISTPEMSSRDLEVAGRSLMAVAQAMGMASAANWIDDETAQDAIGLMMQQLGVDVDMAEVRDRLEKQAQDQADQADARIPDYFNLGASPGPDNLSKAMGAHGSNGTANGAAGSDGAALVPVLSPMAKDLAATMASVSKSLTDLGTAGVIDTTTAQMLVVKVLAAFGVTVTPDEIAGRLDQEAADREATAGAPAPGQPPAVGGSGGVPPAASSLLPDGADVINLDQMALESVVMEVFTPDLHPRGAGGQFAPKPGATNLANTPDAKPVSGSGSTTAEPQAKTSATTTRKPPAHPAMRAQDVKDAIASVQEGDDVTVTMTNGLEVKGKATIVQGGNAVIQTADGKYAILHGGLKQLAKVTTPRGEMGATPAPVRASSGASTPKAPADRSAAAKKAAATRAANKAAAATAKA